MFVLVAAQFVFHDGMAAAFRAFLDGREPAFDVLVAQHILGGWLILAFAVWRLALRFRRGVPPPPEQESPILRS